MVYTSFSLNLSSEKYSRASLCWKIVGVLFPSLYTWLSILFIFWKRNKSLLLIISYGCLLQNYFLSFVTFLSCWILFKSRGFNFTFFHEIKNDNPQIYIHWYPSQTIPIVIEQQTCWMLIFQFSRYLILILFKFLFLLHPTYFHIKSFPFKLQLPTNNIIVGRHCLFKERRFLQGDTKIGVLALIVANKGESTIAVPDSVYVNEQIITQKTKTWKQKT